MLNAGRIIEELVAVCHRVDAKGFVAAADGNISARLPNGNILITPSSLNKGFVMPDDLVEISLHGERVAGKATPSSEKAMHLFIYKHRPDVNAVVHCHPVYATAFAAARIPLSERLFPEVIIGLGAVPLARYATPSTEEVGESIAPYVNSADAVLLTNHGVVTYGNDLWDAYFKMEKVEQMAQIEFAARALGGAKELSSDEVSRLLRIAESSYRRNASAVAAVTPSREIEITEEEFHAIVEEVKKRLHQSA
ncbi:MAG TPA: class II aldolase/adducin family protein [Bacteroidota bacterium]|nr:class II aldolase/adducin family protein [Bacteroidota bacterium]